MREDDDYGGGPTIFSLSGWLVGRGLHELGCGERGARKPSQSAGKSALLCAPWRVKRTGSVAGMCGVGAMGGCGATVASGGRGRGERRETQH